MTMTMFAAIAMLAQSLMPVQGAEGDPFWSATVPTNEVRVSMMVLEGRNMSMVLAPMTAKDKEKAAKAAKEAAKAAESTAQVEQ